MWFWADLFFSEEFVKILCFRSIFVRYLAPLISSIKSSILGIVNGSGTVTLFKFLKSIHNLIELSGFLTGTIGNDHGLSDGSIIA